MCFLHQLKHTKKIKLKKVFQKNKTEIDHKRVEVKNLDFTTTDLKNKLYITVHHIKTDKLDDPRTVCNDCYELDRKGNKMYFVCHDHCYLEGVKEDVTLRPELQECAAISDDDTCRVTYICRRILRT